MRGRTSGRDVARAREIALAAREQQPSVIALAVIIEHMARIGDGRIATAGSARPDAAAAAPSPTMKLSTWAI